MKLLLLLILAGLVIFIAIQGFLKFFYRDPVRIPPQLPNIVLSPADGRICYIKHIKSGEIIFAKKDRRSINISDMLQNKIDTAQDYILIGIQMSFFNVHYQRSPIDGIVYDKKYIPGKFLDINLSRKILEFEGERNVTYIKSEEGIIFAVVIQIASNSVRRIESFVNLNDKIKRGDKIGIIKFGSQVDLVIPAKNLKLKVSEKSRVTGGETIIGEYVNGEAK